MAGGGSQPSTTTQVSKGELPPWVEQASQENYKYAKDLANRGYKSYTGDRIADDSAETTNAYSMMTNNVGQFQKYYDEAGGVFKSLMDYDAPDVQGREIAGSTMAGRSVDPYLNPYIENVENKTLGNMDRSRQLALSSNADKAISTKSFGGSRSAIVDAMTNAESQRNMGDASASLRMSGFDRAMSLLGQDVDRENQTATGNRDAMMRADMANQSADMSSAQMRGAAAGDYMGVGQGKRADWMADITNLLGIGGAKEGKAQQHLDNTYNDWLDRQGEGARDLNMRLSALGMSPYGKTETTNKTEQKAESGTDWATVGLGGLKTLFSAMPMLAGLSDDDSKTDIEKVGKHKDIDIYAYRYKGDPKNYPKVVGPMASDMEKKRPGSVKRLKNSGKTKGKRVVNFAALDW